MSLSVIGHEIDKAEVENKFERITWLWNRNEGWVELLEKKILPVRTAVTPKKGPENLNYSGGTRIWKLLWTRKESCLSFERKVTLKQR